jgi:hypothetical protein
VEREKTDRPIPADAKKWAYFQKEDPMMRQYDLLNRCLKELRGSQVPDSKRLRLEVLLIQTKLALLQGEVESRVVGDAASELEFLGVYDCLRQVCGCYDKAETDLLIGHLEKMKKDLNNDSEAQRTKTRPGQKQKGRHLWGFLRSF